MAVALFGASALALQHKEHVTSFLGRPREQVAGALLWDAVPTLSAALFLVFYAELSFRSRNLLSRSHHRDLGRASKIVTLSRKLSWVLSIYVCACCRISVT